MEVTQTGVPVPLAADRTPPGSSRNSSGESHTETQSTWTDRAVRTQDEVPSANRTGPRTDASICMFGAMRLRNRPMGRRSRDELHVSSATSQLLEALAGALARNPGTIPPPVRQAALRLARECSGSAPSATVEADHDSYPAPPRPAPSTSGRPTARSQVPYCASIRLGRMG